ncbi:methylmalonyl-CoA mutase family protein [uncultured Microscilla sp.]|uniref:methylmalonyl-CoA mutase family protein n=1 Tax=uncultured Microscilla sp. TaxID=432653 RepID=UPI002639A053|nr:methylmalonyl-CoA mutase family protein [uncultured Microscilla sp.]
MSTQSHEKLLQEFETSNKAAWIEKAVERLKDKDFQALGSVTYEGIRQSPFYTAEDQIYNALTATDFGNAAQWQNREIIHFFPWVDNDQDLRIEDAPQLAQSANQLALQALAKGADAVHFDLFGVDVTLVDFDVLLQGIDLEKNAVGFSFDGRIEPFISQMDNTQWKGTIDYDFLANWTISGHYHNTVFEDLAELIHYTHHRPKVKALTINTNHLHNAGANAVQELAFGIATAVEYIHQLTDLGLDLPLLLRNVEFSMGTGSNYFMEIAKFRALRILWKQILTGYEVDTAQFPVSIHAQTSVWNKTVSDVYVNMLRSTTEAMSAVIGGSDALSVLPYNDFFTEPDEFARRIARNVSTLLKEESYLDKVIDVASGAYYIENLTQSLAKQSWALFQQTEQRGGFMKAFKEGFIQTEIEKVASERIANAETGKDVLVGTNKYQNPNEVLENIPEYAESVEAQNGLRLLRLRRVAEGIERQKLQENK